MILQWQECSADLGAQGLALDVSRKRVTPLFLLKSEIGPVESSLATDCVSDTLFFIYIL